MLEEMRASKASGSPVFFLNFNAEADGIKFKSDVWDTLSAGTFMIYPQRGLATPTEYRAFLDGGKRIVEYVAQIDSNVKALLAKLDSSPQDDFFASTNNPYVDLLWALLRNGDLLFIPNLVETYRNAVEGLLIRGVPFQFDDVSDIEKDIHLQCFKITADKIMENPGVFGDNAFFAPDIATRLKAYIVEKGGDPDIIRVKDGMQAPVEQAAPEVHVDDDVQDPAAPVAQGAPAVAVVAVEEAPVDEAQDLVDPAPVVPVAPAVVAEEVHLDDDVQDPAAPVAPVAPDVVAVEEAAAVEDEGDVPVDEVQALVGPAPVVPGAPAVAVVAVEEAPDVEGEREFPLDELELASSEDEEEAPEAPEAPAAVAEEVPLAGGWVDWASHHCSIV